MTASPRTTARELVVGITGHRRLRNPDPRLVAAMRAVRDAIKSSHADRPVTVMSGLAEGVDQWGVRLWLQADGVSLAAVLPASRGGYVTQFQDAAAREGFEDLLRAARDVVELPESGNADEGYEALAHFLVQKADVVVAVWDGRPPAGPGGTGAVVARARAAGRPLAWIRAAQDVGSVIYEGWPA